MKSYRDIGRISHETEEGRASLESVINGWLKFMQEQKCLRSLQWFENASYLLGNPFTRFFYQPNEGFGVHTSGVNDSSPYDQLIAKSSDNRLVRPVETALGMLTDTSPTVRVMPNSEQPADVDAAKVAEALVDVFLERPINLPQRRREMALIAMLCGSSFPETEYGETDLPVEIEEPTTKRVKNPLRDEDEPGEDEYTEVEGKPKRRVVWRRDASVKVWTPFHIDADPGATSLEDAFFVARTTFEDIGWIKEKFGVDEGMTMAELHEAGFYPENIESIAGAAITAHPLYWWQKFQDILESPQMYGTGFSTGSEDGAQSSNQTTFTVMDVKPTQQFPQGRTIVLAGGRLLFCGPSRAWSPKYPERWHKYGKFDWFKLPGRWLGVALLSLLVPLQRRINAIDVLVQANRQFMAIGQWKIPRSAKVSDGAISGIPGHHILYTAIGGLDGPERVEHVGLPQELLAERGQLIQAINDIASAAIIDNDQVAASAARAGSIFEFLRAEKLRSKSPMLTDFEQALESIGQNLLIEVQLNLGDPTLIERVRAAGREMANSALQAFGEASLRDHHAVNIDVTSELRRTPEALEQKAIEFLQAAGPGATPSERNAVFQAIGMDKFMRAAADASIDRTRRMIARIVAGDVEAFLPMDGIDDPAVCAPEFQRVILSERMRDFPPEVADALTMGFDYYAGKAAEAAQAAQAAQIQQIAAVAQAEATGEMNVERTPTGFSVKGGGKK